MKKVLLFSTATVIFGLLWQIPYEIGNFYQYQDEYAGALLRNDPGAARDNLAKLGYFYGWNRTLSKFRLDGLANRYLFYNAPYYQSALDYQTNKTRTSQELENDNSFWGAYIRGNVKWRIAQAMYRHALEMEDKKEAEKMKKEAEELAYSTKEEYAQAIKNDSRETLPPKWNYDLTTNKEARLAALLPKPSPVQTPKKLGVPRIPPNGVPMRGKDKPPKEGSSEDTDKKEGLPQPKRGG